MKNGHGRLLVQISLCWVVKRKRSKRTQKMDQLRNIEATETLKQEDKTSGKEIMMQKQQKKALIIGCGIAGPALALFLKRAGIEADIYEARETPEGFSLSLSSNGVAVLQELGLDGAVFAEGSAVTSGMMWNGKGKRLGRVTLAGEGLKSAF